MLPCERDANKAGEIIYNQLILDKPCMISRFGTTEISALVNYLGIIAQKRSVWKYISGKQLEWWWNEGDRYRMTNNSGFFPATDKNLFKFGQRMMQDIPLIDILGSWQKNEYYFASYFPSASLIRLELLDPYWSDKPWTRCLEGKKVLVVHPFAEIIEDQYKTKRELLFNNKAILPLFELKTVKAVQSLGGNTNDFKDWFEALSFMEEEIDKQDYDICLLGCGAYGLPLAAHVKRKGKKAVHIGGTLQLLFGIWGARWENPQYGAQLFGTDRLYTTLLNEHWVRPGEEYRPSNYKDVDKGCYW